ncbi:glycosyltransferase family 2 protein [Billgrantia endophytica]|uniref:Glycosyl transferase n=1 Tax=Billgrantia endophytica TaxID=2033802 RepID=A0A2N7TY17_9GAMM|nr:glycosyltransferase family 2 protein [Halomonas endophytica]PMR73045.1 glycosyl transferase [Halomonas endophytica]
MGWAVSHWCDAACEADKRDPAACGACALRRASQVKEAETLALLDDGLSVVPRPDGDGLIIEGVSVITPAYNAEDSIACVIESVVAQTCPVVEHIIIDDGSADGTADLIKGFAKQYPHIRYIHQPQQGAGVARNTGIEAVRGRYIAFLDSDDLWLPGKLEAQIGFMQREQVAFSYGDYEIRSRNDDSHLAHYRAPEWVDYAMLLRGCPIGCLTVAYDQEALGKHYMPHVRRGQDWGLWLALARHAGPARKYPGVHAVYRSGGASLSANKLAKLRDVYTIYREQERLGRVRSSWYLARHALSAVTKPR